MSFWSSALDHVVDEYEKPAPNPFPPMGSGKKPRPHMLLIPEFDPPPPTPSPLFLFQLPAKPAAKPAWNPAPERRRRPKVWDLMPDLPEAVEPQQRLTEPVSYNRSTVHKGADCSSWGQCPKVAAPPMKALPREHGYMNLESLAHFQGSKPSPSTADILQQVMGVPLYPYASRRTPPPAPRRQREGFHCGVDLSALWGVVCDFVFSPTPEKTLGPCPCSSWQCSQRATFSSGAEVSQKLSFTGCTVDDDAASLPAREPHGAQTVPEAVLQPVKGPLYPLRQHHALKAVYSSPLSVLSPFSLGKSSSDGTPTPLHSLLAFVERLSSPS